MSCSKFIILALSLFGLLFLTGCYINDEVRTDQVGAQLNKNAIIRCVGPGVYTDTAWWADLRQVNVSTLTFEVEDPEVATEDNQLVGVRITIQARRKGDCDSVRALLSNWSHLLDDQNLIDTIDATAREGIKNGTRGFSLQELLNDRNGLATAISTQLELDASKYSVEVINVTIENIAIDPAYAEVLQATAKLKADEDYQARRNSLIEQQAKTDLFERQQAQLVLAEQLKVEQAQTLVEVEIARRAGQKIAAANEVYILNPQAYELERLRLMQSMFGAGTVYFIPEGTDLTTFFGLNGFLPVQP
jgi:hypothetical protein